MTREEEARAKFAETLLQSEHFKGIVASLKNDTIRDWADAGTTERREQLHRDLHAVGRLESAIVRFASDLVVERKKQEIEAGREKRREQVKNGGRPR